MCKPIKTGILFFALLGFLPAVLRADDRGPSTAEERARYNAMVKKLAEAPLDSLKPEEFAWALKLGADIPDYTVNMCLGDASSALADYKRHDALFKLFVLAPLAVQFQHADSVKDQPAVDALSWNWILDAYEKILSAKPKDTLKFLDDAAALRKTGKMSEFVAKVSCAQGKDWHEPPAWAVNPYSASPPPPVSLPAPH
jgi:hypothetical protein